MTKGNYGIALPIVAALAFIAPIFSFHIPLFLILAYALLAEKNSWLTRQSMMALFVSLIMNFLIMLTGGFFGAVSTFFRWVNLFNVSSFFSSAGGVVSSILSILLFAICVYGVIFSLKEKDVKIPGLNSLVNVAMGVEKEKKNEDKTES